MVAGRKAEWTPSEIERREIVEAGGTVVANMHHDHALIAWAKERDLLVRVDRRSDWGNPFVLDKDGTREEVIAGFRDGYLPHKRSLHPRVGELKGRVLACWCYPEDCHGDVLAEVSATGIIKPPDALAALRRAWRAASPEQRATFREEIAEGDA
jgi:hypothetical protein